MIILDFGSGNTCRNSFDYAKKMVEQMSLIDRHNDKVIIKWQLFDKAGENIPLNRGLFGQIHKFAWNERGYQTTASVFDVQSLEFLLKFDIPFVKIANRQDLYHLEDRIPEGISIIKSVSKPDLFIDGKSMACISRYPAKIEDYEKKFKPEQLKKGISDHTIDWELYRKYRPEIYEVHFCLDDSEGLDAGPFSRRPKQLREIL